VRDPAILGGVWRTGIATAGAFTALVFAGCMWVDDFDRFTPDFEPLRAEGSNLVPPLRGAVACCDDPDTVNNEAVEDGWPLATTGWLNQLAEHANATHYRLGPYSDTGLDLLNETPAAVQLALDRGIYVEIDLVDCWAMRTDSNFFGDDCTVTHGPPPERYIEWVRSIVDAVGAFPNVFFNLGNECNFCQASPQWDQGLYNEIKTRLMQNGVGDRLVGSDVSVLEPRTTLDYRTFGGIFEAPAVMTVPAIFTEDDVRDHTPGEWRAIVQQADMNGTYVFLWRGTMSRTEWRDLLDRDHAPGS